MVAMGVEEQGSFQLIDDKNAGLVQKKDGCNFIETLSDNAQVRKVSIETSHMKLIPSGFFY